MKRFAVILFVAVWSLPLVPSRAMDLKQSRFTQVVNDVQIISAADKSASSAAVNGLFKVPDILRTGPDSRAELVAEDQTITRVGANTVFSFDPANRTIDLQKGSLLFHSPKGRGGGTIQTGSATASVLGTTIVVTTTPDGGFKVLVLEGHAEVKFLKGLAQHLNAGQMTFVLPGGGLSPIIVFRLDANTRGSQLINGFNNALPSRSKIEDEISKQTTLLRKGKAEDTGLLVGNKASAAQVEAINTATLQAYFSQQTGFRPALHGNGYKTLDGLLVTPFASGEPVADALFPAWALSVDAGVNSAALDPHHTFRSTGPFSITAPDIDGSGAVLLSSSSGFFGRNIVINTRNIDLTPYGGHGFFDFFAAKNLNIAGSLSFDIADPSLIVTMIAGDRFTIAPGSTLSADAYYLYLGSLSSMRFDNVGIEVLSGNLLMKSLADLTLNNCSLSAGGGPSAGVSPPHAVLMTAGANVNLAGTSITADSLNVQAGGSIAINGGAAIAASTVILNAGDGILLDNVTMTGRSPAPASLNVAAKNTITVGSAAHTLDLSAYSAINLTAHTINLINTAFGDGSNPWLTSFNGLLAPDPNNNHASMPGYVNFISGVTYGGVLVTSANQSTYVNPAAGSGIHLRGGAP